MCDESLGKVLNAMDEFELWDDTMLIVWTDHGFTLGEHDVWAKGWTPLYEEVAHTPFSCGIRAAVSAAGAVSRWSSLPSIWARQF